MQRKIPRQESLMSPDIENPFVHKLQFTIYDKIKIVIMSVTVVPLRLLSAGIFLVLAWFLAVVALAFRSEEDKKKPLSGWRKSFGGPLASLGRALTFCLGFHNVKVKGRSVPAAEAPMLVAASHSSFFDMFLLFRCLNLPSAVSKKENASYTLFGSLMEFTQPVYVTREDPNSRQNTIKEIQNRAQSGGQWPQIIIFPEGTCTNRSCVINFKPGAFYPGVPVQPVCIKYPNKMDTITWTWDGPGAFTCLWLTLCQFHNRMEIEYLPVYTPSEEEKKDAKIFATNVRNLMAKSLGVPTTDHSFDDCRLMKQAAKYNLPKAAALVEFQKLNVKLGIKFDDVQKLFDKYRSIAKSGSDGITLEEFAEYLHLPVSDALQEVFALYDRNESGVIDFREFVIGLSLVSSPVNNDETIRLAFELFDQDSKGYITNEDLTTILNNSFGMEEYDVNELFLQVNSKGDNQITFDEFKAYAEEKPEYAKVFTTYRQAKENQDNNSLNSNHIKSD